MNQPAKNLRTSDLELTRLFRAPAAALWRCWEEPALLAKWWAPSPVLTRDVVMELKAGGRFSTTMQTPDGARDQTEYCILFVRPETEIILTDMMTQGFRPAKLPDIGFSIAVQFSPEAGGTRYTLRLSHADTASCERHRAMGFHESWGIATSQLGSLAESLRK